VTCHNGQLLRFRWYASGDKRALQAYRAHRKFCPVCRAEMRELNELAEEQDTSRQWELEGEQ
jgi:hypothetical protein